MQVIPTKAALGARIEGLNRADIAKPEIAAGLRKALADHLLLEEFGSRNAAIAIPVLELR